MVAVGCLGQVQIALMMLPGLLRPLVELEYRKSWPFSVSVAAVVAEAILQCIKARQARVERRVPLKAQSG
jgi:hypothetical protein